MGDKTIINLMYNAIPFIDRNSVYGIQPTFMKVPITILGKVKYEERYENIVTDDLFKKFFTCCFYPRKQEGIEFKEIVHQCYNAIRRSKIVFVLYNKDEGIGESVTHEIEFARQLKMTIIYFPIL